MYIPHAADSKETVCGSKVPSFKGCGFCSQMFVGRGELERLELYELLGFEVLPFQDDH